MFDIPSHAQKLSTDGEKLRPTISKYSKLALADCLCLTVSSMCFTPLPLNALQQIAPLLSVCTVTHCGYGLLRNEKKKKKTFNLMTELKLMLNMEGKSDRHFLTMFEGHIMRAILLTGVSFLAAITLTKWHILFSASLNPPIRTASQVAFHHDQDNLMQDRETTVNLQVIKPQWVTVGKAAYTVRSQAWRGYSPSTTCGSLYSVCTSEPTFMQYKDLGLGAGARWQFFQLSDLFNKLSAFHCVQHYCNCMLLPVFSSTMTFFELLL